MTFPVGDRGVEGVGFDREEMRVVIDDAFAEETARDGAVPKAVGRLTQRSRNALQRCRCVGVAIEAGRWLDAVFDPVEATRQRGGVGEIRVAVTAGNPTFDSQARAGPDHPEAGRAIVVGPGNTCRCPRSVLESFV